MVEIRWHGRGGQGAVTSAKLLAEAAFLSGWKGVTSAPSFGAERRGAPITASTRLDSEPIRIYSQVTSPDIAIVLDDSLLEVGGAATGLKPGATVIVNTTRSAAELGVAGDARVVTADVTGAAQAAGVLVGGNAIVSAAILGSIAKATGVVTMESVESAITHMFNGSAAAKNVEAARIAYECTEGAR
ncbi:MAG: pyruvate oxidoreductase subunit gamma [Actinobacteria bacterium HGW-Actinobacteria-7]|jgi:2-oxoacid:acceptor oxidoreductase gamma subunit (pyruvate/2-ketoisovalerate family)|nr:MAG: pyruvate oxidoreductase subunit gamma [Actinobacteria bacterium HGW-Actinobacteria-7]